MVPWQHRYRFPIEWILFLLAAAALWSWRRQPFERA
jgi:MYXO-CTERM domain-containing protein